MSTEYEDEHTMIHEGETPEELEHSEDDAAEHARLAEEKAKKDKKFKAILFGGVGAIAAVFIGFRVMSTPPRPNANPGMVVADKPNNLALTAPQMGSMPAPQQGLATAPQQGAMPAPQGLATPAASAVVPPAPSAALPAPVGMPAAASVEAAASPSASVPVSGSTGVGAVPSAVVVPAADPLKAADPMAIAAPAAVSTAAAVTDPKPAEGFSRGMDELTKKLDELKAMFSKFDDLQIGDRLAKLEARVGALEGRGAKASTSSSGVPATQVRHHVHISSTRAPKVVPIGEGEEMLFSRMADKSQSVGVPVVSNVSSSRPVIQTEVARNYVLHAVIPGRIWVKGADGNSQTFESGEVLPDGAKILKIDPDRGDVVTSKGVLRFDAR